MDIGDQLKGKKVTIMRLGLLGRGVGDAAFLAEQGAEVLVVDSAPQEVMQPSVDQLTEYKNISFKFGPYDLEDFRHCDFVLKGAGTPMDSPEIAEAKKLGIPVKMGASWFAELTGIKTVGITGTRGKSTVTHMLHAIYQEAGLPTILGGNVRGVSTLAQIPETTAEHTAVLELDSWQMQGWGDAQMSPNISIFTTFFSDHLNYYHDDLDAYLADKANIFLYQKEGDVFVLGAQTEAIIRSKYADKLPSNTIVASEADLPADWTLKVPGIHNRYNAGLALVAARAAGIADEVSRKALENFAGVEGRLELVRTVRGVDVYNDTNSTTPDAALVAIDALKGKNIILIMGGADKNLDMTPLIQRLPELKYVTFLAGTGTERIRTDVPDVVVHEDLTSAVHDAMRHAAPGDVLLFSPAFASFGMFTNEYHRGDTFNASIETL